MKEEAVNPSTRGGTAYRGAKQENSHALYNIWLYIHMHGIYKI